jgi:hypothetical protein
MSNPNWRIWKYPVPIDDYLEVEIPFAGRILCVQIQHRPLGIETPCIWVWVDTKADKETRKFRWFGTGHPGVEGNYIGSVQMHGGDLVFHLFEVT